jgi:hypothetical protein
MYDPSFGCDWEIMVFAEYRNSEMYTWHLWQKCTEHKMCVSVFSITFVQNTFTSISI